MERVRKPSGAGDADRRDINRSDRDAGPASGDPVDTDRDRVAGRTGNGCH